ncbi:MAG TPA: hypothetical protein DEA08_37950, partial [Planctomycetes bacterium]|nr:hypothetical protein [Planctomycetota bacterium]
MYQGVEASVQSIGPFKVRIEHAGVVLGEFVFDKDVILMGRAPECDLRINTNTISRKHAELRRSPTGFSVFAISQTNPTAINEIPVPPKKSLILSEGDVVVLAKKFRIFVELVRSTPAPDGPGAATTNRLEPVAGNLRPGSEGGEDLTEPALDVPLSPAELLRDLDGKDSGKWGAGHEAYAALQDDSPARPKREAPLTQPLSRAELEAPSPAPAPA